MQVSKNVLEIESADTICRVPGAIAWNYSRSETIADLAVHIIGLCLGYTAAAVLLALAAIHEERTDFVAALVYALSLLLMLTLSAAYNLWPVCPLKWRLRRFDHSAIYVLIAATYTPFVLKPGAVAPGVLAVMWCVAALGVAIKFALPGRLDHLSIGVCVAMGWSGAILWGSNDTPMLPVAYHYLLAGGMLLSLGVVFHVWRNLRYQNAIWHAFVLLGISCHYVAVCQVVLS